MANRSLAVSKQGRVLLQNPIDLTPVTYFELFSIEDVWYFSSILLAFNLIVILLSLILAAGGGKISFETMLGKIKPFCEAIISNFEET